MKRKVIDYKTADEFLGYAFRMNSRDLSCEGLPWVKAVCWVDLGQYGDPSPWHIHSDSVEIICCRRGLFEYEYENGGCQLSPGEVFLSRPEEPHRQAAVVTDGSYYVLRMSCRLSDLTRGGFSKTEGEWIRRRIRELPRHYVGGRDVFSCFHSLFQMLDTLACEVSERRIRLRSGAVRLLLSLLESNRMKRGTPNKVEEVIREMRTHPEWRFPENDLVARTGLSASGLLNAFKIRTGFAPHAYLLKCRIDLAQDMLLAGRDLEVVSGLLGFHSRQHLSRQFKKLMGQSPRAWLQKHKKT